MSAPVLGSAERGAAAPEPARYAFGEFFTEHMVTAAWTHEEGWHPAYLRPRGALSMDPAMVGLHYGQSVFEGLKAYRQADGSTGVFRAHDHAERFQRSARRLAMPELATDTFLRAVDELVASDAGSLPDDPALSLYLRPLLYASEPLLALLPVRQYQYLMVAFLTRAFFSDDSDPVSRPRRHTSAPGSDDGK